ncbi:uncharacterized protein LOC129596804 [Paramacrobiotus metropolitanus]|uniref:uncharacterized protein LOC129596804 n=1 Tax=Paramacrobiotus metropolitanus TaxID=2943436 RepID=UPI002445FE73|nr:uncharacterized protein LOC129596804 [Paramacrobiotus metropolitanus]
MPNPSAPAETSITLDPFINNPGDDSTRIHMDVPSSSAGAFRDDPPSYKEATHSTPMLDASGEDLPTEPLNLPLPPLYEDLFGPGQPPAFVPSEGRDWEDPEVACDEFCNAVNCCRMIVQCGIIMGIVFLVLARNTITDVTWPLWTGWILLGVFGLWYIIDTCCYNSNMKFLSNVLSIAELEQHVQSIRSAKAEIAWHMECFHHERRTRTVTTGTGRNRHTRIQSYTVKVTTWSGDASFEYAHCEEVSSPQQLDAIEAFKQTRIKFSKQFVLADSAARTAFEGQRDGFVAINRLRDKEYSLTESFEIAGFEPALMASTTEDKPFFLQMHCYILAVFLLLELPFSLMIKMQSRRMDYAYSRSVLGMAASLPGFHGDGPSSAAVNSDIGSYEHNGNAVNVVLELSIRIRPDQPPSYQEILHETANATGRPSLPSGSTSDAILPPLPPVYADVIHNERPFASHPEDARAWQNMGTACSEMFSKCITYWRICLLVGNITGLVLASLYLWEEDRKREGIAGVVTFVVCYILYLIEAFCCNSSMAFLTNFIDVANLNEHVESVRAGAPSIVWHMRCYHNKHRNQSSGKVVTTRIEEVNTWKGAQAFQFIYWEDFSSDRQLDNIGVYKMTRVKFSKRFLLADSLTQAEFERQRMTFIAENKWRDKYYEFSETFDIAGFEPAALVSTISERPFFLQRRWYVLAVLLLLELPFSFMMRMQSTRLHYTYVKYIR